MHYQAGGVHGSRGCENPEVPSGPLGGRVTTTRGPTISSFMLFNRLNSLSGRRFSLKQVNKY